MDNTKPFAFILMPFDKEFEDVYKLGIQETAKAQGVVAERVDEQIYTESILERIYRQIDSADFIISDMKGKNPNVFYEVGYAHAKGKLCTLITQNADDIPFDLKHHRHLIYDGSIGRLKELLALEIEWMKKELERRKTTTFEISTLAKNALLVSSKWSRTGTFDLVIDIHNRTTRRSAEVDAVYLYTNENWVFKQDGKECGHTNSDIKENLRKHILSTTVKRLAPGAWMQIQCEGERVFWSRYKADSDPQDEYRAKGILAVEVATSEGAYKFDADLDLTFDEIPF